MPTSRRLLMVHPSADMYGSDLQMLETVSAMVDLGWGVTVALPGGGPLVELAAERGAEVRFVRFPVLRKSYLHPARFVQLVAAVLACLPRLVATIRQTRAEVVLVNTVTIPWWLLVARAMRRRTICHVHEAEDDGARIVRTALAAPILLSSHVIVNSTASLESLVSVVPLLRPRVAVVHNGVSGPLREPQPPRERRPGDPARVTVVGRLSARKGIDVALECLAGLVSEGRDVRLSICGTAFAGYEWFEDNLRRRADQDDLAGRVEFAGYVRPTWTYLDDADVVLVPSRAEPFGNTAVEALLARRPLVASRVQGLAEIVSHGVNGLLATPGDAHDLADQVRLLLDQPRYARDLADAGRLDALQRFSVESYRSTVAAVIVPPS